MNITTEQLFDNARTQNGFTAEPVRDAQLRQIYDLMKWAPTSANSSPARIVFVARPPRKRAAARLRVARQRREDPLGAGHGRSSAPTMAFYEKLPQLFPHADARSWFVGKKEFADTTAFRNSSLQGGYFILAARALGLDCGPMSGFDPARIDAAFWAGTTVRTNFICNLGHGDPAKLFPRSPRLTFEEACRIAVSRARPRRRPSVRRAARRGPAR